LLGTETENDSWGGIKKYTTSSEEITVDAKPTYLPPMRELKKTAGKNRNQTNGLMIGHSCHCNRQAANGSSKAATVFRILLSAGFIEDYSAPRLQNMNFRLHFYSLGLNMSVGRV
jgi:hypothetical protein